jgi:hypothetical protein
MGVLLFGFAYVFHGVSIIFNEVSDAEIMRRLSIIGPVAGIMMTGLLISLVPAKHQRTAIPVLSAAFLGGLCFWYAHLVLGKGKAIVPEPPARVEFVGFRLSYRDGQKLTPNLTSRQMRAVALANWHVQFLNNGPTTVLVAHAAALDHPKMAVFEIEDEKGHASEVPAQVLHQASTDPQQIVAVRPRDGADLFKGGDRLVEALSKPGTYRIRFAYDATLESDYRKVVNDWSQGEPLPPVRLQTNTVTVTVTE